YRSWGHDIGPEDTPYEAGLAFAVRLDKPATFIGRDALLDRRGQPVRRRLLVFTLDDPEPLVYHDEPIWRDATLVGRVTSGAYGHTVGRAIGLGYVEHADGVTDAFVASGRWELEIAGDRVPARAQLAPPYDPKSSRVRGCVGPARGAAGLRPPRWRRGLQRPPPALLPPAAGLAALSRGLFPPSPPPTALAPGAATATPHPTATLFLPGLAPAQLLWGPL